MPAMQGFEKLVLGSWAWAAFSTRVVAPWVLRTGELPAQADVLEVGSGGGGNAEVFAERFPNWRITASDYDPDMVVLARERLERYGKRVHVTQADASSLGFPDQSFDLVISVGVWHHVGDWPKALAETARVLRPSGKLILVDLLRGFFPGPVKRLFPPHTLYGLGELRQSLVQAGFVRWRLRTLDGIAYRLLAQTA